jgi:hypothetical protein
VGARCPRYNQKYVSLLSPTGLCPASSRVSSGILVAGKLGEEHCHTRRACGPTSRPTARRMNNQLRRVPFPPSRVHAAPSRTKSAHRDDPRRHDRTRPCRLSQFSQSARVRVLPSSSAEHVSSVIGTQTWQGSRRIDVGVPISVVLSEANEFHGLANQRIGRQNQHYNIFKSTSVGWKL